MKYSEIIADKLSKAGWSWGWVSALDRGSQTIWIVDAHRGDGNCFLCVRRHLLDIVQFGGETLAVFAQKGIHLGLQVVSVTDQILDLLMAMILQPFDERPVVELLAFTLLLPVITEEATIVASVVEIVTGSISARD